MAVADQSAVESRLGRSPTPEESAALLAYLDDAEAAIQVRLPDAVTRAASDPVFRQNLIAVECSVALRASGIAQRTTTVVPGSGLVEELSDGRMGFVSVRREEWRRLGVSQLQAIRVVSEESDDFRYPLWHQVNVKDVDWWPDFE